ncbi:MAG: glutamine--fructose-6-phosphate transaminase (isomerizing) [Synergistales bacterium]|nr:glutamine--fructose-6-phosphate transaminase (isomerizing) [Synergistales bacterium]
MCGIVGYIGERKAADIILDGLKRLEYRGYDSAGMSIIENGESHLIKNVGKVADLEEIALRKGYAGTTGIGHTRWATHGGVTVENAHPHADESRRIVLVHNGIIENFNEIKDSLEQEGVRFVSQTDTEVIVQLLAMMRQETSTMFEALQALKKRLRGSYALVIIDQEDPEVLYCIRKGSPLVLGVGENEAFCASDVPAFLPYTSKVIYLNDGDIAAVWKDGHVLWSEEGTQFQGEISTIEWDVSMAEKEGYPHYMLKEINEQGAVLRATLKDRIRSKRVELDEELVLPDNRVVNWKKLHIVACGTSYYAAMVAASFFERWTDLDVRVDIASEYRYRALRNSPETLAVFVSQSGETADTLAAQRKARQEGAHCVAITNVRGSTLAREVHNVLLLRAGPEIGVAATKTFTGQLAALYLLVLALGKKRGTLPEAEEERLVEELLQLPYKVETVLERDGSIEALSRRFAGCDTFLYLGRGFSFPIALEGALKLKEISYIHAEGYAAGEMKHGPIALLEPNVPVVAIVPRDSLYEKMLSNIQEVKARNAPVIAVCNDNDTLIEQYTHNLIRIPWTDEAFAPFLTVLPLQIFAYQVALLRGCEIDQPRNLAKSVTVE